MSTTCVDLREKPAPAAEVELCEQARKEWTLLRDIDLSLRDDSDFVQVTPAGPRSPIGTGSDEGSQDLLLRVAERLAPTDPRLAREVYLEALTLEISRGPGGKFGVSAVCKAAQAAPPVPGSPQATDLALDGLIKRCTEGYAAALPRLRQALDAFDKWDDSTDHGRWGRLMTYIAMDLWDDRRWQNLAARQTTGVAETGRGVAHGSMVDADLGIVISTDSRSTSTDAYSKAVICNGLGRYDEARDAARWLVERDDLGLSGWAHSELVEASTRTGQNGLAARALLGLRDRAHPSGTDLALGIESRACALLSEGEAADVHYQESIEYLSRAPVPIQLARSHLVYGEWLRREGRRVDARLQLRSAQMMFDDIGSKAFAERTRRELLATGETVHKRTFAAYSELTPQEDQIARLASSRLTNSEIGTQLFISPRTVEWHLRKVFTKLGVTSRRELRFS
jgi:DNA-binding CsgD family transcriptional regulator/tetratricopeptide (TPR) repeat protein